ncbi:MAG: diacylglycerol O-acyltransferase [Hyphomicrobiaceae bacterium]
MPSSLLNPIDTISKTADQVMSLVETLSAGFTSTTDTPINVAIGPYRRFDWVNLALEDFRTIHKAFGGSLNDVFLATVAGAVGDFLRRRGEVANAETMFRVMVPVSVRSGDEHGMPGNRVVNFLARLPIDATDPVSRLQRTTEITRELKGSRMTQGAELKEELSDHSLTTLLVEFVKLGAKARAYNMVVTNVPGPPVPIYFLGAQMEEIYPLVALFSYNDRLSWGFNADWEAMPDLHDFVGLVEEEFERLLACAQRAASESTG